MGICWHCGATLPPPKRPSGRQRHYCGDPCRKAADRARRRAEALSVAPDLDGENLEAVEQLIEVAFVASDDPIASASELVMGLRAIAGRARRLGEVAPPGLGWRLETTADALFDVITRCWRFD